MEPKLHRGFYTCSGKVGLPPFDSSTATHLARGTRTQTIMPMSVSGTARNAPASPHKMLQKP